MKKRRPAQWSRLDNAAKIFPPTSSADDPKVFRFVCELEEPVDPDTLQQALDRTVTAFPHFCSVLRKGLFWYYLEGSPLRPTAHAETEPPCAPVYDPVRKDLLFSVSFYRRRINLEVYHALTDGTGALQFLRLLVYHYLVLRHADALGEGVPAIDYDASLGQRGDDSFRRYYSGAAAKRERTPRALRVRGARLTDHRTRVTEGVLSSKALLEQARSRGATVTALLAAALICAIYEETPVRYRKKPVVASIPVNLRKYFQSETARNFFGVIRVSHRFRPGETFQEVVNAVSGALSAELTPERIAERMDTLSALEHNTLARVVPLFLKDLSLKAANYFVHRGETFSLSNLGKVDMPGPLCPYIRLFSVFNAADEPKLCVCSFGDRMVLSLTSPFAGTDLQRRFFRTLSGMGPEVSVRSNRSGEEE